MGPLWATKRVVAALAACGSIAITSNVCALDLEPRAFSNAPVGQPLSRVVDGLSDPLFQWSINL
jgi:hypothetical protein